MVNIAFHRFVMLLVLTTMSTMAHSNLLSELEWQYRPLLVFAPQDDPAFQQTLQLTRDYQCEIDDRDMIIVILPAEGAGSFRDNDIALAEVTRLRNRFDIPRDELTTILIGKDGGEKYRTAGVPDLNSIFSLIDGMPMRQSEMQLNPVVCRSSIQAQ